MVHPRSFHHHLPPPPNGCVSLDTPVFITCGRLISQSENELGVAVFQGEENLKCAVSHVCLHTSSLQDGAGGT
ncbi:hypothetical protein JZ751_002737 [Albula glossodonta]|uniref:Uncharacterized protein n=1 Tax=Albula glossodonta TaxID=121402 RepID=A0A8T2NAN6_9TELE|nr:hypothetical protein JZ751_002737 [Albula glossodonta]